MCNRPITTDGKTFACRTCDACIATRRHDWIARAMMEKSLWPHTVCLALTYDNSTRKNRDAAAMFQYQDIRLFLARLREAIKAAGGDPRIRFLCAGEQGSRNKRCHWHLIVYSHVDLTQIGTVETMKDGQAVCITDRNQIISTDNRKVRCNWSIWGQGFVTFQEPDAGGMHYVLSYVLKDQFTVEKSHETKRAAKAEDFATGLFRMSKRPAIGEAWLWQKFAALDQKGAVLPNLNFKVPDFAGFYHPSGSFREKILWSLVALNKRHVWDTGRNAPQWPSLLESLKDFPPDLEILNGPSPEQADNLESLETSIAKRQREAAGFAARQQFARTCGNELACEACLSAASDDLLASVGVERYEAFGAWFFRSRDGFPAIAERQRTFTGKSNPLCQKRGSSLSRHTFPNSDRTDLARKGSGHLQAATHKNGR